VRVERGAQRRPSPRTKAYGEGHPVLLAQAGPRLEIDIDLPPR
jgi:hypothetical protein